jgi:hypothetical protein
MNTQKVLILSGFSGLMLSVGIAVMLANSHIDIFPCTETSRARDQASAWSNDAPLETKAATCSVLDHMQGSQPGLEEKSELTGLGWAMVVMLCLGVGIGDGVLMYTVLSSVAAKKAAATKRA